MNVADLLERFDVIAQAPGGVQKLRELVLTLAVQGKLVAQDPADEPASVLLERIKAEKAVRLAQGKGKKEKPLPAIADGEKPFALPSGWEWVRVGQVIELVSGQHLTPSEYLSNLSGSLPYITGPAEFGIRFPIISKSTNLRKAIAAKNDILLTVKGSGVGKINVVDVSELAISRQLMAVRFSLLNQEFGELVFLTLGQYFQGLSIGIAIPGISRDDVELVLMALPPIAEQSRIVAKVEQLMALIDRLEAAQTRAASTREQLAAERLAKLAASENADDFAANWQALQAQFELLLDSPESINQLQQTLLQLAVRGKLTRQDPADEPATVLLERIRVEKAARVAAGKGKKEKPLPVIADEEQPFELPDGWGWVRCADIAESRLGKMLDKAKNHGVLKPYLRNTNVQWHRFELDDIKSLRLELNELDEYRLCVGDLLICEGGEPGRCAIWRGEQEMYFQKALHRVRPFLGILPEYIQICLTVDAQSGSLEQYFTGATIKHFAGQELQRYVLPLPPLAEQSRIVAKIEQLTTLCLALKNRLETRRTNAQQLSEATLQSSPH